MAYCILQINFEVEPWSLALKVGLDICLCETHFT